jgi:hypothetical protein
VDESAVMQLLGEHLRQPNVAETLEAIGDELLAELESGPDRPKSTFRAITLDLYGELPPAGIKSAWLFALRKGFDHPPEYHPNSIQRMFALNRRGRFSTWDGAQWITHHVQPGDAGLSIPADTWHRAPALDEDWVVASFHTAAADALVEIVGDPASGAIDSSRTYLADA